MTLALATIRTNIYTTLYNHLQTGTYALTTNNIHPSYTHLQRIQEGYPQVVINEPTIEMNKITFGTKGLYEVPFSVVIDIYEDNSVEAKSQADEISNKILTGRVVLQTAGIKRIKFDSDSIDVEPYSQIKTLHNYHLLFTGVYIGTI